jgi:hypothetical protein
MNLIILNYLLFKINFHTFYSQKRQRRNKMTEYQGTTIEEYMDDFILIGEIIANSNKIIEKLDQIKEQIEKKDRDVKISKIAGISVGAVGGVVSIVGICLSPVTLGISLGLTIGGSVGNYIKTRQ